MKFIRYIAVFIFAAMIAPESAMAHGELHIRIATLTRKIKAATNNPAALYLQRGELYREDKSWKEAEADYTRAAQLDPKLSSVDFCRAKLLDDTGKPEAARVLLDKILSCSPSDGKAFIARARVFMKLNQPKPAIADFRRGLDLLPDPQPEYFLELARTFATEQRTTEALDTLDFGLKKIGTNETLQSYALELELRSKRIDGALARVDSIIQNASRKESWFARRGNILLAEGRLVEARKSFRAALEAIKLLPVVLQQASPMQKLQSEIHTGLAKTSQPNSPGTLSLKAD